MKRSLWLVMVLILLFSSVTLTANAAQMVTMYAPDGRTTYVYDYEVPSYKSVGWYEYPVTMVYAPGNRSVVVASWDVSAYTSVGWFTYPVVYVFDNQYNAYLVSAYEANDYAAKGFNLPIYNNNGITVGLVNASYYYHYNNWGTITSIDYLNCTYLVLNGSGKHIVLEPTDMTVNDYSVYGYISDSVAPGEIKCVTATVNGASIYNKGIRKIREVEMNLNVRASDYSFNEKTINPQVITF